MHIGYIYLVDGDNRIEGLLMTISKIVTLYILNGLNHILTPLSPKEVYKDKLIIKNFLMNFQKQKKRKDRKEAKKKKNSPTREKKEKK